MSPVGERLEVAVAALGAAASMPFDDFRAELDGIAQVLSSIDEALHPKQFVRWTLEDLHHSDATVVLGATLQGEADDDAARRVLETFFASLDKLSRGHDAEMLNEDALEGMRKLLRPIGETIRGSRATWRHRTAEVGIELKHAFGRVKFNSERYDEEWQGLLEEINVHPKAPTFRLYPVAGPSWITCQFDRLMFEVVNNSLTRKVMVEGEAVYRPKANYPHRIYVSQLSAYEDDWADLTLYNGALADSRQSIFDKLQALRDEWPE